MRALFPALAAAVMAGACAVHAASTIEPREPSSFDPVNLRMTVDSCMFNASSVQVIMAANLIRVGYRRNQCLVPGTPEVVDVRLGSLPIGSYRVAIHPSGLDNFAPPEEELSFEVRDRPEIAIFPPPPRPLTDYSGLWFNPQESGWGVSIHQGASHTVFAMLFVYDADQQPDWYTIQLGRWTSATTWTGTVFRTTGPGLASGMFDPMQVFYVTAGTATLDFKQVPGEEGVAKISYTIHNVSATKPIRRMPL